MLSELMPGDDAAFADACRVRGWKQTAQRRAVFRYLCANREHPTVDAVWRGVRAALPNVSLDSVYRILDDFSGAGLIKKLESGKAVRYDADTAAHQHFVCSACGRLIDFACADAKRARETCGEFGRVDSVELTVRGVCRDCLHS